MGNGAWSNDAITTLVIPTGATTGARVVIDGITGSILIYNAANQLVGQIDPTGLWIYDADGSYVHAYDENPGDGAVVDFRPPNSVGTINAPARIGVATDPLIGGIGTSLRGAQINGNAAPGLYFNSQGLFLDAPQATGGGLMVAYADAGIVLQAGPNGDIELQDQNGVTRLFMNGTTGELDLDLGTAPGGNITFSAAYDSFNGPGAGATTTSASFANVTNSTNRSIVKHYTSSSLEFTLFGGGHSSIANTVVEIGINIGGVDELIAPFAFNQINTHCSFGGFKVLYTGLAAASYTCRARWRRASGTGTITTDNNDQWSMRIREVI